MNLICKEGKNNNTCNRETDRIKQKGYQCKKMDIQVHTANQNFLNNNRMERQEIREGVWSQSVQYSI